MDRYDAWKPNQRQLELLRQIQHAAGLDPDGPRLVPMRPASEWCEDAAALCGERYRRVDRDAMLRRALRFL